MINKACVDGGKPLVSGAAIRMEGQLAVFDVRNPESPCYHCLYPDFSEEGMTCSESGVLSPLVGLIGSLQALETVKLLAQVGEVRLGRLTLWDAARTEVRQVRIPRDPQCPTCSSRP